MLLDKQTALFVIGLIALAAGVGFTLWSAWDAGRK